MNTITIDIPESALARVREVIEQTVSQVLENRAKQILAEPRLLTREEAAKLLRISLPTLRNLERNGSLIPRRAGRKVLYDAQCIDLYLRKSLK